MSKQVVFMASVTKRAEEKSMADEELPDDQKETQGEKPKGDKPKGDKPKGQKPEQVSYGKTQPRGPGFFTIYKSGQGYWTRLGTLLGVIVIGGFTAWNIYRHTPTMFPEQELKGLSEAERIVAIASRHTLETSVTWGVTIGFILGYAWLAWRLMNKPKNVDFLIATDSEMKKVNWTTRKELIGSTQIVVLFMFLIALFLFAFDIAFQYLFFAVNVLKSPPFGD